MHVAAALNPLGALLGTAQFPVSAAGYRQLLTWLRSFGDVGRVGVEGTGSYGGALARHLTDNGVQVIEVSRPNRQVRRRHGKTDTVDAIAAARAVMSGEACATPKTHDGLVESLRVLKVLQRSANKSRTQAINQLKSLLVTAPPELRSKLQRLPMRDLLTTCSAFRVAADDDTLAAMTRFALRDLAQRIKFLDERLNQVQRRLRRITVTVAPQLVALHGVGPDTASTLLITAGDNPQRLRSERSFAALTGCSPIPASSGKTHRHRLNRGGDRQANSAIWRIAIVRMANDERSQKYIAKRMTEGKSKIEAIRCLKRYIAREIFDALPQTAAA